MNLFLNSRLLQILPLFLITSLGILPTSHAADWFQFRGPGGLDDISVPLQVRQILEDRCYYCHGER